MLLAILTTLGGAPVLAQEGLLLQPRDEPGETLTSPAPRIDPEVDPQADQAIAARFRSIYATLDGLGSVTVRVNAGVVVLEGEVATQELAAQAERLARQVDGVVEVADEVTVATGLERRITPAVERIVEGWRAFVRLLPVLAVAGAIFLAFVLLGRLLRRPRYVYRRIAPNPFLASLLAQIVQGAVLLTGAFAALLLLDATAVLGTLLGAAGILGLALGFALRDTVENYIASLLLSLRRPFGPEDFVRIADQEGIVLRLTSRATILLTLDGQQVRIPNAIVFKGVIVNYTEHATRRFAFTLGIAPDADLAQAQQVAIAAVSSVPGVIHDPGPTAFSSRSANPRSTLPSPDGSISAPTTSSAPAARPYGLPWLRCWRPASICRSPPFVCAARHLRRSPGVGPTPSPPGRSKPSQPLVTARSTRCCRASASAAEHSWSSRRQESERGRGEDHADDDASRWRDGAGPRAGHVGYGGKSGAARGGGPGAAAGSGPRHVADRHRGDVRRGRC